MSIKVHFYTFGKKSNSTAQPTGDGNVYDCTFLEGADILSPAIRLNVLHNNAVTAWNYCYIPDFSRYYFIQRWFFADGMWNCVCAVDVLASWKSAIGSHSGYVLRCSSHSDGDIKDTFYPGKANPQHVIWPVSLAISGQTDWAVYMSDGYFVVGIIGPNGKGNISYYVMDNSEFDTFCNIIYTNAADWSHSVNITDISSDLLKVLFDPFTYVTSVMWFPISVTSAGTVTDMMLGWWPLHISGTLAGVDSCPILHYKFTPYQHPQAATRGNYLNSAPYTSITIDFQPFGLIALDANLVCGKEVDLYLVIDYVTGSACLRISTMGPNNTETRLYSSNAQIGVPIQIAGRTATTGSMISGAAGMLLETASAVTGTLGEVATFGSSIFNSISNITSTGAGIANQLSEGFKRVSSTGSNGGRAYLDPNFYVSQDFIIVTDEDNAQFGRPLYQVKQISTLSGYVQMGDADIQMGGMAEEIDAVRAHMVRGFFYE